MEESVGMEEKFENSESASGGAGPEGTFQGLNTCRILNSTIPTIATIPTIPAIPTICQL